MTQYDPNLDRRPIPTATPGYTETVETTVVREANNTGWWIAGILGGLVLIAVLWILFARGGETPADDAAILDAQADLAAAQAQADAAAIQGQVAGAQASVDIARADAARSQAEAARAAAEARAAEARAATPPAPVIVERSEPGPAVVPAPTSSRPAVVTPTAPQN